MIIVEAIVIVVAAVVVPLVAEGIVRAVARLARRGGRRAPAHDLAEASDVRGSGVSDG